MEYNVFPKEYRAIQVIIPKSVIVIYLHLVKQYDLIVSIPPTNLLLRIYF